MCGGLAALVRGRVQQPLVTTRLRVQRLLSLLGPEETRVGGLLVSESPVRSCPDVGLGFRDLGIGSEGLGPLARVRKPLESSV